MVKEAIGERNWREKALALPRKRGNLVLVLVLASVFG